jgi:D-alanyl-D-alanine carboxypeptidase (penicillin-binding protein 5/6)
MDTSAQINYLLRMRARIAACIAIAFMLFLPGRALSPSLSLEKVEEEAPELRCLLDPLTLGPLPCASAILVEARTGAVLYEQNADAERAPASLAKMMLMVVALEEVARQETSLQDSAIVSERAPAVGGARVPLVPGEKVPLGALLEAVALISANDAAIAIAEHLSGTEEEFVARMNERARWLGCESVLFANCHGLDPPSGKASRATARDLAQIARRLVELPHALRIASLREARYRGLHLETTNDLLGDMAGVDGLKTGFTARAGGCFCGSIERDGVRFISVVLGAEPGQKRFEITRCLFESAYEPEPRWVESLLLASSRETK